MPSYAFQCSEGCEFDAFYTMAEVPRSRECSDCGATAVRAITAPHLSRTGASAFKLIDGAERSAHEPEVTTALPGRAGSPTPVSTNPLHAKLPRS